MGENNWYDGNRKKIKNLKKHFEDRLSTKKYSKIIIGTDSQVHRSNVNFVTVIILDTNNLGAQFVYNKIVLKKKEFISLNERLLKEVEFSIDVAYKLLDQFNKWNIPISIHADVNPNENFASQKVIKQVVGWIEGSGFECHVKPEAFAASCVADKFTQ